MFPLLVVAGGAFRPACASGRTAGALIPASLLARGPSLPGLLCVFALAARRASFPLRGTLPAFRALAALLRRALLALLRRLFAALARICLPLRPLLHRALLALRLLRLFFHRVEHRFQHNDLLGNLQLRFHFFLFRSALPAQQLHLLHMEGLRRGLRRRIQAHLQISGDDVLVHHHALARRGHHNGIDRRGAAQQVGIRLLLILQAAHQPPAGAGNFDGVQG